MNGQLQSILGGIPMSRAAQQDFVRAMADAATDGNNSPLRIIAQAKSMLAILKDFCDSDDVKHAVLCEYRREFGDAKSGRWGDVEFAKKEVGTKYDYAVSADWLLAQDAVKNAEARRRAVEERLKTASPACPYVDIATGEEISICPRSSETQVAVSIK